MNIIQISDWNVYQRDGEQFLGTAHRAFAKHSPAFSNEALYNIICMGIEKLVMAYLMKNGDLADNHTMIDLLDAVRRHIEPPKELAEELLFLGTFQEICDEDKVVIKAPDNDDISHFLSISDHLQDFLAPHLS